MVQKNKRYIIFIIIVAATYNAIYSLAYMKGLYYTLMQSGLHLSHFQLGQLYSAYGIFAMIAYLCGAFFLSRFPHWKLITVSSLIVFLLTVFLATTPPYPVMFAIFGVFGFLLGATFYPAHLEVLHQLGGEEQQGTVFGMFFVFNSLFGVVFASTGMSLTTLDSSPEKSMQFLFIFFAALNLLTALLSYIFLRKLPYNCEKREALTFASAKKLFSNKKLLLVMVIVFTNYLAYANTNYILPYLSQVFHVSDGVNNILSIVRVYLIGIIAAPIAGGITDKLRSASKLMGISFGLHSLTIIIMLLFFHSSKIGAIICVLLICLFATMGKSMALVTIDEASITPQMYGLCISLVSFCSYSPDAFYLSVSGWILDTFPKSGYQCNFLIAAISSLIGIAASVKLSRKK